MSVLREDPTTGGWIILAPGRQDRPHESREKPEGERLGGCPLCPGHEEETPAELLRIPSPDGGPWAVRVVPNRFPVLSPSGSASGVSGDTELLREIEGVGHHELVVDAPEHDRRMAAMRAGGVARVLDAYHARYMDLRRDRRVAYVIVFKNSGARAGASLAHPHSQIVATPMAPLGLAQRYARARAHHDATGRCLYCDLLDVEVQAGRRVVHETPRFVVWCPFASGVSFETWIAPRHHQPSFGATSPEERSELGDVLRSTLHAMDGALGEPDFNYVLHTAPVADEEKPYYLWHLQILPRIATLAGFELGSGIPINTVAPEDAAPALRSAWPAEAAPPGRGGP